MTPYIIRITFPKMSSKILKPFSKKMSNHFSKYLSPINQFSLGHYSMGGEIICSTFFFRWTKLRPSENACSVRLQYTEGITRWTRGCALKPLRFIRIIFLTTLIKFTSMLISDFASILSQTEAIADSFKHTVFLDSPQCGILISQMGKGEGVRTR